MLEGLLRIIKEVFIIKDFSKESTYNYVYLN